MKAIVVSLLLIASAVWGQRVSDAIPKVVEVHRDDSGAMLSVSHFTDDTLRLDLSEVAYFYKGTDDFTGIRIEPGSRNIVLTGLNLSGFSTVVEAYYCSNITVEKSTLSAGWKGLVFDLGACTDFQIISTGVWGDVSMDSCSVMADSLIGHNTSLSLVASEGSTIKNSVFDKITGSGDDNVFANNKIVANTNDMVGRGVDFVGAGNIFRKNRISGFAAGLWVSGVECSVIGDTLTGNGIGLAADSLVLSEISGNTGENEYYGLVVDGDSDQVHGNFGCDNNRLTGRSTNDGFADSLGNAVSGLGLFNFIGIYCDTVGTLCGEDPSAVEDNEVLPENFELRQNYPNPFNPSTTIEFSLPEASTVMLTVCDILGREVAELINQRLEKGSHTVTFDASDLPSGMYFYTIRAGAFNQTRRMLLIK